MWRHSYDGQIGLVLLQSTHFAVVTINSHNVCYLLTQRLLDTTSHGRNRRGHQIDIVRSQVRTANNDAGKDIAWVGGIELDRLWVP